MEIIIIALVTISAILLAILVDLGNEKRYKPHLPEAPAPENVTEETPEKDISEPVISFVNFLKENPENFLLKRQGLKSMGDVILSEFKLIDKVNRKTYTYSLTTIVGGSLYLSARSVNFLTEDENNYLLEAHEWGMKYIEAKEEVERKARDLAEREEYKKIYCKEK